MAYLDASMIPGVAQYIRPIGPAQGGAAAWGRRVEHRADRDEQARQFDETLARLEEEERNRQYEKLIELGLGAGQLDVSRGNLGVNRGQLALEGRKQDFLMGEARKREENELLAIATDINQRAAYEELPALNERAQRVGWVFDAEEGMPEAEEAPVPKVAPTETPQDVADDATMRQMAREEMTPEDRQTAEQLDQEAEKLNQTAQQMQSGMVMPELRLSDPGQVLPRSSMPEQMFQLRMAPVEGIEQPAPVQPVTPEPAEVPAERMGATEQAQAIVEGGAQSAEVTAPRGLESDAAAGLPRMQDFRDIVHRDARTGKEIGRYSPRGRQEAFEGYIEAGVPDDPILAGAWRNAGKEVAPMRLPWGKALEMHTAQYNKLAHLAMAEERTRIEAAAKARSFNRGGERQDVNQYRSGQQAANDWLRVSNGADLAQGIEYTEQVRTYLSTNNRSALMMATRGMMRIWGQDKGAGSDRDELASLGDPGMIERLYNEVIKIPEKPSQKDLDKAYDNLPPAIQNRLGEITNIMANQFRRRAELVRDQAYAAYESLPPYDDFKKGWGNIVDGLMSRMGMPTEFQKGVGGGGGGKKPMSPAAQNFAERLLKIAEEE